MSEITNPRQVILVTSRSKVDILGKEAVKDNIMTLAWHMPCSFNPELYAISVGKQRYSHQLIHESKVFAVNFIPFSLEEKALFCGTHSGEHLDKFEAARLTKEECDKIDCCRIKEAIAYIECEVIDEIEAGDHTIFIGKVLNSSVTKHDKRLFQSIGRKFTTTI